MTHPEDLLAGYVDGTLTEEERAVVDSHLATCSTCGEEVGLARAAVPVLGSLSEEPVPFGVTGLVLAEARKRGERTSRAGPFQWAIGLAAAAAIVAALAVAIPKIGGGANNAPTRALGGAGGGVGGHAAVPAASPTTAPLGLEHESSDYDQASVQALASLVARQRASFDEAPLAAASATPAPAAAKQATDPSVAIRCLRSSGAEISADRRLVRLIEATYEGTPAYLGVFLDGHGAGRAPDTVVVRIVSKGSCQILDLASKHIS